MTVTLTDRLDLTRWGSDADNWSREQIVANFDAIEALVARFDAGTAGTRPSAASVTRRLYLASDTDVLSVSDGTDWHTIATLDVASTWAAAQTFTAAIIANGGIAPTDGQLEVTGDVAVSGKFGANGATAQARASATAELKAALVAFGLLTDGGATPLDLDGGTFTAGPVNGTNGALSGTLAVTGITTLAGALKAEGGITATDGTVEVTGNLAVSGDVTVGGASVALDSDLTTHVSATGAHAATKISNTPAGNIAATTVQAAIDELDTEKAPKASPTFTGTTTVDNLTATGNLNLGNASTDLIGFYGATAVVRPGTYNLTGSADRTLGAYASDAESSVYTGATDGEAKLVDLNALRVAYENLRVYVEDLAGIAIATATDLKTLGLVG